MRRRLWFCALLTALPLAGCTTQRPAPDPTSAPPRPALKLVAFDSCGQLLTELRAATRQSVGSYGLGPAIPEAMADGSAMRTDRSDVPAQSAPHSDTNVHEQGADEPDMVKTDGRRIVTVVNGILRVVDPVTRAQTGRLDLGTEAVNDARLLLAGDRALVLISGGSRLGGRRMLLPPPSGVSERY